MKFRILVDTAEQHPWLFRDIPGTGHVPTRRQYLGTKVDGIYFPRADYAIDGHIGECHIERKSGVDMQATILGFNSGRRKRFERELEVLAGMPASCVIIESTYGAIVANPPVMGVKSPNEEAKIIHRTVMSWQIRYHVPFFFCDTRRFAEITAYRFFERYLKKRKTDDNDKHAEPERIVSERAF